MGFEFWFRVCRWLGHRPAKRKHPQQVTVECRRCKCIIDLDGQVVAPPLAMQRWLRPSR